MKILCANGNPVRIRTAKALLGVHLHHLGYRHFHASAHYDICHTEHPQIRLVKTYRYGNDHCDMSFYTADLEPIKEAGTLYHIPKNRVARETFAENLNQMLKKAIFALELQSFLDADCEPVPSLWFHKEKKNRPDIFDLLEEELPF